MARWTKTFAVMLIPALSWLALAPASHGEPPTSDLAAMVVARCGKPDDVRVWNKSEFLDYRLANGQVMTIAIKAGRVVWAGLKADLAKQVGQKMSVLGIYGGPGKQVDYITCEDGQTIYIGLSNGDAMVPKKGLAYGKRVKITGTLARHEAEPSARDDVQGLPEFYYFQGALVELIAKE